MHRRETALKVTTLTLGLFLFSSTLVFAEVIKSFESLVEVNTDNSINVVETIIYDSEGLEKHGIFRNIRSVSSEGRKMSIRDLNVSDSNGIPHNFTITSGGGSLSVKIGDADVVFEGEKTYVIDYIATDAVAHPEGDVDEIYWNATGNDWPFTIEKASARVILPQGAEVVQEACYEGAEGSREFCATENGLFVSSRELAPGEGMTVALGFPKGIVPAYKPETFLQKYGVLMASIAFPVLLFAFLYRRWKKYGRDPKGTGVIVPQYDVPEGLTPMEVSLVLSEKPRTKDISAELIYLATFGYLKIRRTEEKILGLISSKSYELTLLKNPSDLPNEFDRKLLLNIFSDTAVGTTVALASLKEVFYTSIPPIFKSVGQSMLQKKYYKNLPMAGSGNPGENFTPAHFARTIATFFLIGIPVVVFLILPGIKKGMSAGFILASLFVSVIIFVVFQKLMPAKTEKGVAAKEHILGLKDYLQIAEKDRLKFHNSPEKKPEVFEKLLPYALVLGVENSWAKEFKDIYRTPPSWYEGADKGGFNAIVFASSLSSFNTSTASALASAPGGGSGSGGGGSSGGGGGGGGGGSW